MLFGAHGSEAKPYLPLFNIRMSAEFDVEKKQEKQAPQFYLSEFARQKYRAYVQDGHFYTNGKLLCSTYLYVLMPDDTLYIAPTSEVRNHSFLANGEDVKGAGMIYFSQGQLITISNESGHYKPKRVQMIPALKWFAEQIGTYNFLFEDHSTQNAHEAFDGINYSITDYLSGDWQLNRINLEDLPEIMSQLYESSFDLSGSQSQEDCIDDFDTYSIIDCYYSEIPKFKRALIMGTLEERILATDVVHFSCLKNFKDPSQSLRSRYKGRFRASTQ